jgi:ribosomal protein L11 methylase PrmA
MAFKDARIVELGCGDGSLLMEVANALNIKDVYGVDIDEMALKKATDRGAGRWQRAIQHGGGSSWSSWSWAPRNG